MIETKEAAKILGCTEREFRRAAAVCEDRQPWKQWGAPGRFAKFWRSDELDAIRAVLAEPGFRRAYADR